MVVDKAGKRTGVVYALNRTQLNMVIEEAVALLEKEQEAVGDV